jgi:hypothetical protein
MCQVLASAFPPPIRRQLAAALVGRKRPGNPYRRRDWLRVSQRLASGMSPEAVARAEGTEPEAVAALLGRPDFQGLVDGFTRLIARPAEEQRARLVRLARLALENALMDWDPGAALFVLDQDAKGQDPAEALADAVQTRARRPATTVPPEGAAARPAAPVRPTRPSRYDALDGLVRRGTAKLRAGLLAEHALHHAADAGEPSPPRPKTGPTAPPAAEPAPPPGTTAEAARQALALRAAAERERPAPRSPAAGLARRLGNGAAGMALLSAGAADPARPRVAGLPHRPRGP